MSTALHKIYPEGEGSSYDYCTCGGIRRWHAPAPYGCDDCPCEAFTPNPAASSWAGLRAPVVRVGEDEAAVLVPIDPAACRGAAVTAVQAYRAALAYQHFDDLGSLGAGELRSLLLDVSHLARVVASLEAELIAAYRGAGASWADLGAVLQLTEQGAQERHQRITQDPSRRPSADSGAAALIEWIRGYAGPATAAMTDAEALAFAVAVEADHLAHIEPEN